jgi:hypothetical protein
MEEFFKRTRVPRWILAMALLVFGAIGGLLNWFNTCEQTVLGSGDIKTICRDPSISDAAVVFAGILFLLLIAPDFDEAGLFGFALKRRVEQQEKKQQALEGQVGLISTRVNTMASSTATSTTNVYYAPAPEAIEKAKESLSEKEAELGRAGAEQGLAGPLAMSTSTVSRILERLAIAERLVEEPTALADADLRAQLLAVWEELNTLVFPAPRGLVDLVEDRRREPFRALFADELEIVRAARNACAHAQPIDRASLEEAVGIGNRLLGIAREAFR